MADWLRQATPVDLGGTMPPLKPAGSRPAAGNRPVR